MEQINLFTSNHPGWAWVTFVVILVVCVVILCYCVDVIAKLYDSKKPHRIYHNEDGSDKSDTWGQC